MRLTLSLGVQKYSSRIILYGSRSSCSRIIGKHIFCWLALKTQLTIIPRAGHVHRLFFSNRKRLLEIFSAIVFPPKNPFLSDLWRGHDETFTVHIKPTLIGEPCMNCWLLSAVKCEYWIVSQTMIFNWSFSLHIFNLIIKNLKMSSFLYDYDLWREGLKQWRLLWGIVGTSPIGKPRGRPPLEKWGGICWNAPSSQKFYVNYLFLSTHKWPEFEII